MEQKQDAMERELKEMVNLHARALHVAIVYFILSFILVLYVVYSQCAVQVIASSLTNNLVCRLRPTAGL